MKLIEDIRNNIGQFLLNREASDKKKRDLLAYDQIENIGIVYDAAYIEKENIVHQYASRLRADGKKVFMLGFVDTKQLPGNKKFSMQSEYFWKEKLSAFNLPVKNKIGRFLETEFDWLLNLHLEPILPMLAVAAYSGSKYRVGPSVENGLKYFDAMIDTGGKNDLSFFIEQLDFYLKVIK